MQTWVDVHHLTKGAGWQRIAAGEGQVKGRGRGQGCWATTPQAKVYSRHTHLKARRASPGQDRRGTGDAQETHGERRRRLETDKVGEG